MKLYIANLSLATTEEELQAFVKREAFVFDVKIIKNRNTEISRGFAFVTISDDRSIQQVIKALQNRTLNGRKLTIAEARPKGHLKNEAFLEIYLPPSATAMEKDGILKAAGDFMEIIGYQYDPSNEIAGVAQ